MEKNTFEVYWQTKTAHGFRQYSRFFGTEEEGRRFLDGKKKPSTKYAFLREVRVSYDGKGRASEIKIVRLVKVIADL